MPIDLLALGAALLAGLIGGVHCVAMCGGIAAGLSAAGGGGFPLAWQTNLGRVLGYTLAGALVGLIGGSVLRFARSDWLFFGARMLVGVLLVVIGLRLLGIGRGSGFGQRSAQTLWQMLRPLQARLLPADRAWKRLGLGVLWGWLPCGLSLNMLAAAWLQGNTRNGALLMLAFGLGTLPIMLPLTWSGSRIVGLLRGRWRHAGAWLILLAGLLTLAAPWLMRVPMLHGPLAALGCLPPPT